LGWHLSVHKGVPYYRTLYKATNVLRLVFLTIGNGNAAFSTALILNGKLSSFYTIYLSHLAYRSNFLDNFNGVLRSMFEPKRDEITGE
jgi:hypothetical protein